jgi:DinB superfamily
MSFDSKYFIDTINRNSQETFDFIQRITPSQLEIKQEGKWNVLENLEHVFLTEKLVCIMLGRASNLTSEKMFELGESKLELKIVNGRTKKLIAPESLHPKGKIKNVADFIQQYSALRENLIKDIIEQKMLIDKRVYKHIYLGKMTVADWLIFLVQHNKRHLLQIKDLLLLT